MDSFQSSSQLVGNLGQDQQVLARGRVTLIAVNQGPSSIYAPYYYVYYSKVIESLNVDVIRPRLEVWESSEFINPPNQPFLTHQACPYTQWRTGARDIERIVNIGVTTNPISKTTGADVIIYIEMFSSTADAEFTYFYTLTNETIGTSDGSLYPSDGSFT